MTPREVQQVEVIETLFKRDQFKWPDAAAGAVSCLLDLVRRHEARIHHADKQVRDERKTQWFLGDLCAEHEREIDRISLDAERLNWLEGADLSDFQEVMWRWERADSGARIRDVIDSVRSTGE